MDYSNIVRQCYCHRWENHYKQREPGCFSQIKSRHEDRVPRFIRCCNEQVADLVWVLALLCGGHLSTAECTTDTAIDVIRFPDARDEIACLQDSMMTVAPLAIRAGPDEYWKFVCMRPQSQEAAGLTERTEVESP